MNMEALIANSGHTDVRRAVRRWRELKDQLGLKHAPAPFEHKTVCTQSAFQCC